VLYFLHFLLSFSTWGEIKGLEGRAANYHPNSPKNGSEAARWGSKGVFFFFFVGLLGMILGDMAIITT